MELTKMDDRELMELAAKAAGINYTVSKHGVMMIAPTANPLARHCWNPLEDDGDALRLAVRLGLGDGRAFVIGVSGTDRATAAADGTEVVQGGEEPHGDDPYAATRRAIVRAAAEIGLSQCV